MSVSMFCFTWICIPKYSSVASIDTPLHSVIQERLFMLHILFAYCAIVARFSLSCYLQQCPA